MLTVDNHLTPRHNRKTFTLETSPIFTKLKRRHRREPGIIRLDKRRRHLANHRFFSLLQEAITITYVTAKSNFFMRKWVLKEEQFAA